MRTVSTARRATSIKYNFLYQTTSLRQQQRCLIRTSTSTTDSTRRRKSATLEASFIPRSLKPFVAIGLFAGAVAAAAGFVYFRPGLGFLNTNSNNNSKPKMSSKLIPANPSAIMVIRDVTPNVVTFSVPFLRFGKIPIGGRGTVVRLTSGGLAVFSPVALTDETKAKVQSLGGDVKYLVALDIEHHIFLSDWARAYPGAKLVGPEGLPEKRAKMNDDKVGKEPFAVVFTAATKTTTSIGADFDADFEYEYADAHPNKELVFFYKPDRVLIEADFMFNLPAVEQYSRVPDAEKPRPGLLARTFASWNSTEGEAKGMKRLIWYAFSRGNREGFNATVRRIDAWDFRTIIPCHGDTIEGNGKEVYRKVFDWHLKGHK